MRKESWIEKLNVLLCCTLIYFYLSRNLSDIVPCLTYRPLCHSVTLIHKPTGNYTCLAIITNMASVSKGSHPNSSRSHLFFARWIVLLPERQERWGPSN